MECPRCHNVFEGSLGLCPSCGLSVENQVDELAEELEGELAEAHTSMDEFALYDDQDDAHIESSEEEYDEGLSDDYADVLDEERPADGYYLEDDDYDYEESSEDDYLEDDYLEDDYLEDDDLDYEDELEDDEYYLEEDDEYLEDDDYPEDENLEDDYPDDEYPEDDDLEYEEDLGDDEYYLEEDDGYLEDDDYEDDDYEDDDYEGEYYLEEDDLDYDDEYDAYGDGYDYADEEDIESESGIRATRKVARESSGKASGEVDALNARNPAATADSKSASRGKGNPKLAQPPRRSFLSRLTQVLSRQGRKESIQVNVGEAPWVDASFEGVTPEPKAKPATPAGSADARPGAIGGVETGRWEILDEWIDWELDEPDFVEEPGLPARLQSSSGPKVSTEIGRAEGSGQFVESSAPRDSIPIERPVPGDRDVPRTQDEKTALVTAAAEASADGHAAGREAPSGGPVPDEHAGMDATAKGPVPTTQSSTSGAPNAAAARGHGEDGVWGEGEDDFDYDSQHDLLVLPDDDDPYVRASAYETGGFRALVRRWRTVLIAGVSLIAIVGASIYSVQWNQQQVKREQAEAAAAEEKKKAETPVEIILTLDLGGYDASTMTPAPLHVVGSTAKGPSVDEIVLLRPVRDALVMERGSYLISVAGPVLSVDGELYEGTIDSFALSITADGATVNGQPVSIGAGSAMEFLYNRVEPQNITDSEIESAQRWMLDAEVVNYQAYINAVLDARQRARNELATEQVKREEEERKAAEEAAKKAEEQKKKLEQEKKKKKESSSGSSSDSSSSDSTSSTSDSTTSDTTTDEYGTNGSNDSGTQDSTSNDSGYDEYAQI